MSEFEGYLAMHAFLRHWFSMTECLEVKNLLVDMLLLKDDRPYDPAIWDDWLDAIRIFKEDPSAAYMKITR